MANGHGRVTRKSHHASVHPFHRTLHFAGAVRTDRCLKRDKDLRWSSWRRVNACIKLHRVTYSKTLLPLSFLWLFFVFCIPHLFHTAAASARENVQLNLTGSGEEGGHLILNDDLYYFGASSDVAVEQTTSISALDEHSLKPQAAAALRHLGATEEATREEDVFSDLTGDVTRALPTETSFSQSSEIQLKEIDSSEEKEIHQEETGVREEEEEDEALVSDWQERSAASSLQQCVLDDEGSCVYEDTCDLNAEEENALSASNDKYAADHSKQHGACPLHRRMQELDVSSLGPAAQYAQYVNTFLPAAQQRQQLQLLQQAMASGAFGGATNLAALKRLQRRAQAAAYANSVSSHPLVQGVVRTALTAVADILGNISVADVVHGAVGGALMAPVTPFI
ncbi:hypothetical protein Emed_003643 [Eimeria media]